MRNHIAVKAAAIFLCSLTLLAALTSGFSVLLLAAMGISETHTVEDAYEDDMSWEWRWAAENIVRRYAARTLGGFTEEMVEYYYGPEAYTDQFKEGGAFYAIQDREGNVLESDYPGGIAVTVHSVNVSKVVYSKIMDGPVYAESDEEAAELLEERLPTATAAGTQAPSKENGVAEDRSAKAEDTDSWICTLPSTQDAYYRIGEALSPEYTVLLYLTHNAMAQDTAWNLVRMAWNYRNMLMAVLGVSLLLFAFCTIYLCCAAGRGVGSEEVRPGGLNRFPLDLYALIAGGIIAVLCFLGLEGANYLMWQGTTVTVSVYGYAGFVCCLLFVGFCFAFVAQLKAPGWFWVKNAFCVRCFFLGVRLWKWCWRLFVRACRWCWKVALRIAGILPKAVKAIFIICWSLLLQLWRLICRICGAVWKKVRRVLDRIHSLFAMLPLTWQWLVAGACMPAVLLLGFSRGRVLWALVSLAICAGLILYGANCFGTLLKSTRRMREGDLNAKVNGKLMVGAFRVFAEELNCLAGVAVTAARNQLKSERMKTELITNVSHDIKTPLTSIINYVDLLQKPHSPEEETMYLEILSRQSNRMKKLIEDLIEMSKASTGNMPVEITRVDASEAVNQSLGEFSDKLAAAQLITVYHQPAEEIAMYADGRLVWRAMSNVLSNAVKYAMPGTRLYVDLSAMDGKVMISVKNVSRDELNISADELMERFVRGDSSRNTEGSGLGLNIAKSLMELQHGELQLLVDGDLFKVTLIFPQAT